MPRYKVRVQAIDYLEAFVIAEDQADAYEKAKILDGSEFVEVGSEWIVDDEVELADPPERESMDDGE